MNRNAPKRLPTQSKLKKEIDIPGVPVERVRTSPFVTVHIKERSFVHYLTLQRRPRPSISAGVRKPVISRCVTDHTSHCRLLLESRGSKTDFQIIGDLHTAVGVFGGFRAIRNTYNYETYFV